MKTVYIRFYEELNDFLPILILVNSKSVEFNYILNDKDEISVYPVYESFDIKEIRHLRQSLREPKFILDVQLGSLAKYMRMEGLD